MILDTSGSGRSQGSQGDQGEPRGSTSESTCDIRNNRATANGEQDRSPSPDDIPEVPPPPYTRRDPHGIPPRPPRRCTCPRRENRPTQDAQTGHTDVGNGEGSSGIRIGKAVAGAALVGVAAPVLAVAGAAVMLPAIGFGASVVIAGSLAATIHSVVYGGSTCGLFSLFQSAGATIAAPAVSSVVTAAGAAVYGGKLVADATSDGSEGDSEQGAGTTRICQCTACECADDCACECRRRLDEAETQDTQSPADERVAGSTNDPFSTSFDNVAFPAGATSVRFTLHFDVADMPVTINPHQYFLDAPPTRNSGHLILSGSARLVPIDIDADLLPPESVLVGNQRYIAAINVSGMRWRFPFDEVGEVSGDESDAGEDNDVLAASV